MVYQRLHPHTSLTNPRIFRAKYRFSKPEVEDLLYMVEPYLIEEQDQNDWIVTKMDQVHFS